MALTINFADGAESGGGEFATLAGATSQSSIFRSGYSGGYAYEFSSAAAAITISDVFEGVSDGGTAYGIIFAFRIEDFSADAEQRLCILDSSGGNHGSVRFKTNGDIAIYDSTDTEVSSASHSLVVDTWYQGGFYIENSATGDAEFFVADADGANRSSLISATSEDFDDGGSVTGVGVVKATTATANQDMWIDDIVFTSGLTGTVDMIDDGNVVYVTQSYGNTTQGSTSDTGDNLDAGTWANAFVLPAADGSVAGYTGNPRSGSVICNDGTRTGPSGDIPAGATTRVMTTAYRAMRGSGGGTTHNREIGNDTDGTTTVAFPSLTTGFLNYVTSSNAAGVLPTSTENAQLGMGLSGAQDLDVSFIGCQIGVTEVAPSGGASALILTGQMV